CSYSSSIPYFFRFVNTSFLYFTLYLHFFAFFGLFAKTQGRFSPPSLFRDRPTIANIAQKSAKPLYNRAQMRYNKAIPLRAAESTARSKEKNASCFWRKDRV
ncbi:MAG: hypothetical protein II326_04930, partial [Clostridia bacterium]|nr:hypothetical protein [Clostridia bacterium]